MAADTEAAVDRPTLGEAVDPATERRARIGWGRAIGTGVLVLVLGLAVSVGGANWVVTDLTGLDRDQRVWLATGLFLASIVVAAWVLRRLQARGIL